MNVEVVYATAREQTLIVVELTRGATVREAIETSGLLQRYAEIDLRRNRVGIFGEIVDLDTEARAGDRIEVYRPLSADPKEIRRRRARKKPL